MEPLMTAFMIASSSCAGGMAGAYIGSKIRDVSGDSGPYLVRIMAGFTLGAVLSGGVAAAALGELSSIREKPSDIEQCADKAPPGSTLSFTRNADGSSTCTYEMK